MVISSGWNKGFEYCFLLFSWRSDNDYIEQKCFNNIWANTFAGQPAKIEQTATTSNNAKTAQTNDIAEKVGGRTRTFIVQWEYVRSWEDLWANKARRGIAEFFSRLCSGSLCHAPYIFGNMENFTSRHLQTYYFKYLTGWWNIYERPTYSVQAPYCIKLHSQFYTKSPHQFKSFILLHNI